MNNIFFIVSRIYYKGESESHSIEIKTDKREATQRFYNVIAADLADAAVTYQYASITDCYGNYVDNIRPVVYDRRAEG